MPNEPFRVQQVDHIERYVPDQYGAAAWYEEALGIEIMKDYEFWANEITTYDYEYVSQRLEKNLACPKERQ
jgi:hypothetical protein